MWRYWVGAGAALALTTGGVLLFSGRSMPAAPLPAAPPVEAGTTPAGTPLPDSVPEATERTREQKRFDRYDKDRDGKVTRDEYLMQRRKAFAKLDTNRDGQLSFDEWAIKAETKFATADRDRSNILTAAEFATTAVKRKPPRRVNCPPASAQAPSRDEEG